MSLGSAATARVAVTSLMWPLFLLSLALLAWAHYRVWIRNSGHPTGRIILVVNTVLVLGLWAWRFPV